MTSTTLMAAALTLGIAIFGGNAAPGFAQQDQPICGSQLMTNQERNTYRNQMRTAVSEQEREQIRWQHHQQMQERAKAQGVTLPDMPMMAAGRSSGGSTGGGRGRR
jgi:hypothetical protein